MRKLVDDGGYEYIENNKRYVIGLLNDIDDVVKNMDEINEMLNSGYSVINDELEEGNNGVYYRSIGLNKDDVDYWFDISLEGYKELNIGK